MSTKLEVVELDRVSISHVTGGRSLSDLGVTFNPRAKYLSFLNVGTVNIYVNNGAASTSSYLLVPYAGASLKIRVLGASKLRFFVTAVETGDMNVQQEGD